MKVFRKTIFIIIVILLMFPLASCKKNDELEKVIKEKDAKMEKFIAGYVSEHKNEYKQRTGIYEYNETSEYFDNSGLKRIVEKEFIGKINFYNNSFKGKIDDFKSKERISDFDGYYMGTHDKEMYFINNNFYFADGEAYYKKQGIQEMTLEITFSDKIFSIATNQDNFYISGNRLIYTSSEKTDYLIKTVRTEYYFNPSSYYIDKIHESICIEYIDNDFANNKFVKYIVNREIILTRAVNIDVPSYLLEAKESNDKLFNYNLVY